MAIYTIDTTQDLIDLSLLSGKFEGIIWRDNLFNLTTDLDLTGVDPLGDDFTCFNNINLNGGAIMGDIDDSNADTTINNSNYLNFISTYPITFT